MFHQIALGTGVLMVSIMVGAISVMLLEELFERSHDWLVSEPHLPKLILLVSGVSFWVLGTITMGIWLWAFIFFELEVFSTLEESVYFAMVVFTTLGFGDVLLPHEWRLLAGMAAANGFLNIGLLTALLIEALRQVRLGQAERRAQRRRHHEG